MTGSQRRGSREAGPEVLVVDDDRDWGFFVGLALEFEGFRVLHAFSGEEALAMIDEGEPDAIVLDIGLPGVDGWEVLRRLADRDRSARIPVIVVSGRADGAAAWDAKPGGRAYLPKPCHAAVLARTIRSLCRNGPVHPPAESG
jgi:DNA-binding response OmpR family regulator